MFNYEGWNQITTIGSYEESITTESEEGWITCQESDNLEKMILSTGIRVGTPVKTKIHDTIYCAC